MKVALRLTTVIFCVALMAGLVSAATAPTVTITSPEEGLTVASRVVTIEAAFNAAAGAKVTRMELAVDGTTISAQGLEPAAEEGQVSFTWLARDYTAGKHRVTVRAIGSDGKVAKQSITVELRGALDKSDNGVSITSPAVGETVSGTVEVKVEAGNPGLARYVIFLVDDTLKAVSNVQPFMYKWDTTRYLNGTHYLKVKVYAAGEWEAVSEPVEVTVDNPSGATAMRTPAIQATPVAPAPVAPPVRAAETALPPAVRSESLTAAYPTAMQPTPELAVPGTAPYVDKSGELVTPPAPVIVAPPAATPMETQPAPAAASDALASSKESAIPVEIAMLPAEMTPPAAPVAQPAPVTLSPAEITAEAPMVAPVAPATQTQTLTSKPSTAPAVEVAMLPPKPLEARPAPRVVAAAPIALGGTREAALQFNGKTLALDTPAMVTKGRAIVPLRAVVEQAGGKVAWDSAKRTASAVSAEGRKLAVTIGSEQASVDGKTVAMATAAELHANRTVVSARFLGDALDLALQYEDGIIRIAQAK